MVSAFRGHGVISANFGAFDASTIDTWAAADVLRYPTLRSPTATDADARKGCRKSIMHFGSPAPATASTPVAPRDTSIDHELRAHFVIELVGKLDDLAAIKDGNALHRFFCVVFAPPAFLVPKPTFRRINGLIIIFLYSFPIPSFHMYIIRLNGDLLRVPGPRATQGPPPPTEGTLL